MTHSCPYDPEPLMFTVTDLRQYIYCPRIVYYAYCLPLLRPVTFKMEVGAAAHEEEKRRERRRGLRTYGLPEGERVFDPVVKSPELGLSGRMDMVIRVAGPPPEAIPVEYKHSRRAGTHVKRQLAAYALLIREVWHMPVHRAYVYFIPMRKAQEMRITDALLAKVRRQVMDMREMVLTETMPPPPSRRAKCTACEFRRFCNDLF